ncbi:MAG: DUF5011 domain-containing protein, partial [Sulfurovaceae bacterium]
MRYFLKTTVMFFALLLLVGCSNAGRDQNVNSGDLVTLDGSGSSTPYPGEKIIGYQWEQISGPTVTLQNANSAVATFIAPEVSESTTLKFQLIKKKLFTNVTETVTITVLPNANQNQPPVAIIDANATEVNINEQIQLSAANSSDSDGEIASYAWYDETDTLIGSTREITYAFQEVGTHTLKLTVTDDKGAQTSATKTFTITAKLLSITLNPATSLSMETNTTTSVTAQGAYEDSTTKDITQAVTWSSSDTTIVSIDKGVLSAHKEGTVTITASLGSVSSDEITVTVTEPLDATPPVITLNGEVTITLTVGDTYTEQGATALDDVDGNVTVTISGTVDTSTEGNYTITYSATDSAGNTMTAQRIVVVNDNQYKDETDEKLNLIPAYDYNSARSLIGATKGEFGVSQGQAN